MLRPGASSDRYDAMFVKDGSVALEPLVAPTLIADEMHPGELIPTREPSLPAATTVAMPLAFSALIDAAIDALLASHGVVCGLPSPMLMFTALTLSATRLALTQSRPSTTSVKYVIAEP